MALISHDGSPDPRVEPHPGRIEDAVIDSRPSREALERELVRVHDELTQLLTGSLAADRRPEALGVDRPGGLEGAFDRHWRKIRRELGGVYRDYRAGRASAGSALRRATRIGVKHGVLAPRDALAEFLRLRDKAVGPTLAGAGPLTMLPGELDSERARIWLSVLERHYRSGPARTAYFEQLRRLALRDGQISTALDATAELASSNTSMARAAVDVNGRMTELSGWLPRLPGPVEPVSGCGTNVVLHLLKESRPYLSNGFTSRTQWNLLAEKDAGWTPVVLTEPGFPEGMTEGRPSTVEEVDGIEHRRILTGASYRGVPFDRWLEDFAFLALDHVRNVRPDVLHVSSGRRGYETALVGLALREKTGLPLVYEVRSFFEGNWTPDLDIEERSEVFRRRREVETRCMIAADRVLTLGQAMKDEIVARGVPAEKVDIVPNGVQLDRFTPAPRDPAIAARHGITLPTFGYVSNMDHPREGHELLIRAALLLQERGVEAQCVLVGGGRRFDELRALARELGIANRVVFTGPVDHAEVAALYGLIDVFVVPRINERAARYVTPLKPFEAMALRRPVVVSDLPALREIVAAPRRGLTFPVGDVTALAETIARLLKDPAERQRLGAAGREWVEAERQWVHNGPRYDRAYHAAINARRRAGEG